MDDQLTQGAPHATYPACRSTAVTEIELVSEPFLVSFANKISTPFNSKYSIKYKLYCILFKNISLESSLKCAFDDIVLNNMQLIFNDPTNIQSLSRKIK
jgi:hypothetical protein